MIHILDKKDCCGCNACVQRCPKHCIVMKEDEEGFLYPHVDVNLCVQCGLCQKVCPVINQNEPAEQLGVYAAVNSNLKVRMQSSSGGVFTMLAEAIIDDGGVVFGVGFNQHWEAEHSYTETKEGLKAFRMSKYVQSIVGNTYKDTENFLKQGRKVLYSGTPCQIAGLKKYLRKDYDTLLCVDFICHGTPSPGVFRWYLAEEMVKVAKNKNDKYTFVHVPISLIPKADVLAENYGMRINDIRFRDKREGWKKYSFVLELLKITSAGKKESISLCSTLHNNPFLRGFLQDLYLRPSCHYCPSKNLKSGSDITIADYWGINKIKPEIDDDKGISAVVIKSEFGMKYFNKLDIRKYEMNYDMLCKFNPSILHCAPLNIKRNLFFNRNKNISFQRKIKKICGPSKKQEIMRFVKNSIKLLLGMDKTKK